MQVAKAGLVVRGGLLDVHVLAADHAAHRDRGHEVAQGAQHAVGGAVLLVQHELDGLGEEAVAREDRHVLPEHDVAGGLAAAQLVVIHRGEVVVDQGVGVDQLDGRRQRDHVLLRVAERLCSGEGEHRPDPLATREQRVAHRLL